MPLILIGLFLSYFQVRDVLISPDPQLEFVHPSSVAYMIANRSGKLAEDDLVAFGLFDLDVLNSGTLLGILLLGLLSLLAYLLRTFLKTTIVETVKHEFSAQRQEIQNDFELKLQNFQHNFEERWRMVDRKDKFRLAALDEKLKAHQEAYALARQMPTVIGSEDKNNKFFLQCDKFFSTRSLYLTQKARDAFWKALSAVHMYQMFVRSLPSEPGHQREKALERLATLVDDVLKLPSILASEVNLEVQGDKAEKESIDKN